MELNVKEILLNTVMEDVLHGVDPEIAKANKRLDAIIAVIDRANILTEDQREEFSVAINQQGAAYFDHGMSVGFETGKAAALELLR